MRPIYHRPAPTRTWSSCRCVSGSLAARRASATHHGSQHRVSLQSRACCASLPALRLCAKLRSVCSPGNAAIDAAPWWCSLLRFEMLRTTLPIQRLA